MSGRFKLKAFHYIGRIAGYTTVAHDLLPLISENKDRIRRTKIELQYQILKDSPSVEIFKKENPGKDIDSIIKDIASEQLKKYPEWVLNQAIVSYCSYFDGFLEDTLDAILHNHVNLVLDTKAAQSVNIKQVIDEGLTESLSEFRRKEVKSFSYLTGIEKRLGYYESKLEITKGEIFNWDGFTGSYPYDTWNLEKLVQMYSERHDVIHRQEYPIHELSKVDDYSDMISSLILKIGILCMDRYSVILS